MSFATWTTVECVPRRSPAVTPRPRDREPSAERADLRTSAAGWSGVAPCSRSSSCVAARRARDCEHRDVLALARGRRRRAVGRARRRRDRGSKCAADPPRRAPGIAARATCCSPSTARRSRRRPTSSSTSIAAHAGTRLSYTLLRLGTRQALEVSLAPAPRGNSMYFVLAAVGLFTLLVGASVRLRRPRDQATLHFFWLCVAFFGVFTLLVQRTVRSARLGVLLG